MKLRLIEILAAATVSAPAVVVAAWQQQSLLLNETLEVEQHEQVISWKNNDNAVGGQGSNASEAALVQTLQELHSLLDEHESFSEDVAMSSVGAVMLKVESFEATVDSAFEILSLMQENDQIPPEMAAMVNTLKEKITEASKDTKKVLQQVQRTMGHLGTSSTGTGGEGGALLGTEAPHIMEAHEKKMAEHKRIMDKHRDSLRAHPKMRQHMEMHEALSSGKTDFVTRVVKNFEQKYGTKKNSKAPVEDDQRRNLAAVTAQCQKLVGCVEEYSLYDLIAFFYGPYVDDQGEIADNLEVANMAGSSGILTAIDTIRTKIQDVKDSNYNNFDDCQSLLQQFHTNEDKDDFVIYHGATVSKVCRNQGSTKYILIEEIREKIGADIANMVFDDIVKCSASLGDTTFLSTDGLPRIPTGITLDEHGANQAGELTSDNHYVYDSTQALFGMAQPGGKKPNAQGIINVSPGCATAINKFYADFIPSQSAAIFKTDAASDPEPVLLATATRPKCATGREITSVAACQTAGLSVGGHLSGGSVTTGAWGHTPKGCFLSPSGVIHFSTGSSPTHQDYRQYQLVCKGAPEDDEYPPLHVRVNKNMQETYISAGYDADQSEFLCSIAHNFGRCPNDYDTITSTYLNTCHRQRSFSLSGLFSSLDDGARDVASRLALGEDVSAGMVCAHAERAKTISADDYVPIKYGGGEYAECPHGGDITTVDQCRVAGLAVGGHFKPSIGDVQVGNWDHTPTGCFLWHDGRILFDNNPSNNDKVAPFDDRGELICMEEPPPTPGWCCLDSPFDMPGEEFGTEYTCDMGMGGCQRLAPVLAGLSESACEPWSGTWCPLPRDCSELKDCVQVEIDWATTENKVAYLNYLTTAPNLTDTMSLEQCGDYREYFGFDKDYPLDDEICEDIAHLRHNRNFDNLDENYGENRPGVTGDPPEDTVLIEPKLPKTTAEEFDVMQAAVHTMEMHVIYLGTVQGIHSALACPADLTGAAQTSCAIAKNIMTSIIVTIVGIEKAAVYIMKMTVPSLGPHKEETSWHEVEVLYPNMVIMNDGINNIRDDLFYLRRDLLPSERRRHLLEASCDTVPEIACGFSSTAASKGSLSKDLKTLFLDEEEGSVGELVDTGFWYELQKTSCLSSDNHGMKIDVVITSNEHESKDVLMGEGWVGHEGLSEIPEVFVSPSSCSTRSDSSTKRSYCKASSSKQRFYEISLAVSGTIAFGNDHDDPPSRQDDDRGLNRFEELSSWTSKDTCRVVVVPKEMGSTAAKEAHSSSSSSSTELRGRSSRGLGGDDASSNSKPRLYKVDEFFFAWKGE